VLFRSSSALEAGEQLDATVVNMRFIKPLDTELVKSLAANNQLLVTIEENALQGGAGSAVNEYLLSQAMDCELINLGLPDRFVEHGSSAQLLAECGLDAEGIIAAIKQRKSLLINTILDTILLFY